MKVFLTSFLENYGVASSANFGGSEVKEEGVSDKEEVEEEQGGEEEKKKNAVFPGKAGGGGGKVGVWCDACGERIGGVRFKCLERENYDLVRFTSPPSLHSYRILTCNFWVGSSALDASDYSNMPSIKAPSSTSTSSTSLSTTPRSLRTSLSPRSSPIRLPRILLSRMSKRREGRDIRQGVIIVEGTSRA